MRLIGFDDGLDIAVGYLDGDSVVSLGQRAAFWRDPYAAMAQPAGARRPLAGLTQRPAVPPTAKVICIGLNYRAHAQEAGMAIPTTPVVFARWAETLICDGDASPAMEACYDWEAELGVVIGRHTLAASAASAPDAVLGYCTFNDLSARTLQMETAQWALGKNSDRSGPMGPVVTADEAGDPAAGWRVTTHVNGVQMQNGITSDFIFDVPTVIAHVSRAMTLHPGDLIITGTPAGVGLALKPPRFLKAGDVVRVEVGSLGAVTTPIVARP